MVLVHAPIWSQSGAEEPGEAGAHPPRLLEELGVLPTELRESSGLAISRTQAGVLWSHNDSGDGPNLYAVDSAGHLLATVTVEGAAARDWEDIALGPCPSVVAAPGGARGGPGCLFIADTGDNDRVRKEVTVYVVAEPVITGNARQRRVRARSFRYRYPEGPDDSEALAVLPDGDVLIVSKGRRGTIDFFALSADQVARGLASGVLLTADYDGNTGIVPNRNGRLVTAAALSPDGRTLAVRTYREVYFFRQSEAASGRWRRIDGVCTLDDAEPQGEAIDFVDADQLLLTSETSRGRRGTIHRVRC